MLCVGPVCCGRDRGRSAGEVDQGPARVFASSVKAIKDVDDDDTKSSRARDCIDGACVAVRDRRTGGGGGEGVRTALRGGDCLFASLSASYPPPRQPAVVVGDGLPACGVGRIELGCEPYEVVFCSAGGEFP